MSDPFPTQLHKGRLEGLSDGVFSVVMTLMVIDLKLDHLPPHATNEEIWSELATMRRPLFGYAFSFAVTAAFWMLQHRKFHLLAHTTLRHAWLTLLFLFWITLLPFTVSTWVHTADRTAGLILYFGHMTLIAATLLVGWLDAKRHGLLLPSATPAAVQQITYRIAAMTIGCGLAAVVSCFWPQLSSVSLVITIVASRLLAKRSSAVPAVVTP